MSIPLRVLIVEDSEDDTILILRELQKGGYTPIHERVETAESMQKTLAIHSFDLVLSDFRLPQFSGPAALALLHEMGLDLPFILISGAIGEINAVSLMKAGAHDFVAKGSWARLIPAVARELREAEGRRMRRQGEERLKLQGFILENMAEGLVVYDERGTILITNHTFDLMFHYESGELIGRHISLLNNLTADDNAGLFDQIDREIKLNGTWIGELTNSRKDGSPFFSFAHISTLVSGQKRYMISVQQDITERKLAQSQIEQRLDRLTALHEIGTAIASFTHFNQVVKDILDKAINLLPVDAAVMYLWDPFTRVLEFSSGRSGNPAMAFLNRLEMGENLSGKAAIGNRLVTQADLTSSDLAEIYPPERWVSPDGAAVALATSTYVNFDHRFALPLKNQSQLIGVFEVFTHQAPEFDQEWFTFFEALGEQLALMTVSHTLVSSLQQATTNLIHSFDAIIEGCARIVDRHTGRLEGYTRRLVTDAVSLANQFDLKETEITDFKRGAWLFDVGLGLVPEALLLKTSPLIPAEKRQIERHPALANELIYPISFLRLAIDIPYCHHERWDGSGYPRGLCGEQIPLAARIFSVVEVWHAMLADRPYRPAMTPEKAAEYLKQQAGCLFDSRVIDLFLRGIE